MGIKDFFASEFETSDIHLKPVLQTHYYRAGYEETKSAILKLIREYKGKNIITNDQYQEISFQASGYSCVFSVINMRPTESAVDIKISFNMFSLGRGPKLIEKMYQRLNQLLPFKGTSLYK